MRPASSSIAALILVALGALAVAALMLTQAIRVDRVPEHSAGEGTVRCSNAEHQRHGPAPGSNWSARRGVGRPTCDQLEGGLTAALADTPRALDFTGWGFVNDRHAVLRSRIQQWRSRTHVPKRIETHAALLYLRHADVVLVADVHTLDVGRWALSELIEDLSPEGDSRYRALAVGVEMLPAAWQPLIDAVCRADEEAMGISFAGLLHYAWPWPIAELACTLDAARLRGQWILGLGHEPLQAGVRTTRGDSLREPHPVAGADEGVGRDLFLRGNEVAVGVIARWLAEGREGGRQVVALFGLTHVTDHPGNLPRLLRARGYRTIVVIPFLREIAELQLRSQKLAIGQGWIELEPGLLYPPYVSRDDICAQVLTWRQDDGGD